MKFANLIIVNLLFGCIFWFFTFSTYSFKGSVADIILPLFLGVATLKIIANYQQYNKRKTSLFILLLPSLSGFLYFITTTLFFMGFNLLGTMFFLLEYATQSVEQKELSPNGMKTAVVYLRPVGAYAGGIGRISVKVYPTYFPLIEQDAWYSSSNRTVPTISWENEQLLLNEAPIDTPSIEFHEPVMFTAINNLLNLRQELQEEKKIDEEKTPNVQIVPLYPDDRITHDQYQFVERENNQFRSYNVQTDHVKDILEWHKDVLSKSPWQMIETDFYQIEEKGIVHLRYCIKVKHERHSEHYYWEFMGKDIDDSGAHVNIGYPYSVTQTCEKLSEDDG